MGIPKFRQRTLLDLPLFLVPDTLAWLKGNDGAQSFQLQHVLIGKELERATQVRIVQVRIRLTAFAKDILAENVGAPGLFCKAADIIRNI